ncbi:serine/threonine-protein kinase [Nocardioides sp. 1609]|uniref:serine/threonine-protein kinase n=1 Tax=Nocardioides sp. 1609 TaxID=2508327 RepID=UPI001FD6E3C6|nr:serine/threonine-protein kinase [Nocardioides sp. 1609]
MPHPSATRAADPPLAGRYQLIDLLGVGGMGAVWRAWDLREHGFVAVKLLHRLDAAHLQRFVLEQGVRIDHPHVAAPTGWVADDDRVALAMPLARGGSVADLLAEHGALPLDHVVELLGQLLDGLGAVHAAGVVHRDLKPANLLLEPTGRGRPHLRIGDFGVAAVLTGLREPPGSPLGTEGYAAPEQLAGAPADPRQDLYAVGVVARVLAGGTERLGQLAGLVATLTDPAPGRRPASAAEAAALLRTVSRVSRVARVSRTPRHPVPDRLGAAPVPLPPARRRPRHAHRPRVVGRLVAAVALAACFLGSAVGAAAGVRGLLGG